MATERFWVVTGRCGRSAIRRVNVFGEQSGLGDVELVRPTRAARRSTTAHCRDGANRIADPNASARRRRGNAGIGRTGTSIATSSCREIRSDRDSRAGPGRHDLAHRESISPGYRRISKKERHACHLRIATKTPRRPARVSAWSAVAADVELLQLTYDPTAASLYQDFKPRSPNVADENRRQGDDKQSNGGSGVNKKNKKPKPGRGRS